MSKTRIIALMFLMGWLTGVIVEDGDLSSIDADRRLQVTRSWHTGEPEVTARDAVTFGVRDGSGTYHAWYGMGQSIAMLPADVLGMRLLRLLSVKAAYVGKLQQAFLVYSTFPIVSGLGCVAVFLLLSAASFTNQQALFGVYGLLYGSTFLNYTQVNQENSLMLLCFAVSLWACIKVSQGEMSSYGIIWGIAAGYSILIRLTTLAEVAVTIVIALMCGPLGRQSRGNRLKGIRNGAAVFSIFVLLERVYHHHRFGNWTSTYFRLFKEQRPEQDLNGSFWSGFYGFMFGADDSVWLFDPLAVLAIGVLMVLLIRYKWSVFDTQVIVAIGSLLILSVYVIFYSPISFWNGGAAWGSRYTTTPMQILSALGAAWFWKFKDRLTRALRVILILILCLTFCEQILSVVFWHNLEEVQAPNLSMSYGVIGDRLINVTAKLLDSWEKWGRGTPGVSDRLRCWNFMPFLATKYLPALPAHILLGGWVFAVAVLVCLHSYIWQRFLIGKGSINE